jgi:hypothetical protein
MKAAQCEELARAARDTANRPVLITMAAHWRTLGKTAKERAIPDAQARSAAERQRTS